MASPAMTHHSKKSLIIGILLVATTLRAPFTGLAPLLATLGHHLGLGTMQVGLLTTLPLLAFALLSPMVPYLTRYLGLERSVAVALVAICLGVMLRALGTVTFLYLGTVIIGAGIAVGNVILPSLLKRDFVSILPKMTGAYSLTMGISAALASVLVVPLATHLGWAQASLSLLIFPLIALIVWAQQLKGRAVTGLSRPAMSSNAQIWRSSLAWQITLFLGLNSLIYYVLVSWLPVLLVDSGFSATKAGSLHGLLQLATALPGLIIGAVIARYRDQRWLAMAMASLWVVSLVGLWGMPGWAILWVGLGGIGSGAAMILGLSLIGLRSRSAHQAVALSGMAQAVGYLLAAAGPAAMGKLHEQSGSWHLPLLFCLLLAIAMMAMGLLAGKNRLMDE
ncbi:MFS transporter, CP family, cyanate transporter [Rosenbergiella nectarea]|uniref:MFS transporter, CP family, cyanate transporter n=1 Tax=Rosenbergiella nectarea TaxID=988801 RepID=A0A1H9DPB2_9GAMM|nr:MFS transporter [Rosenbergiella nectarea]SEQ15251.1 MFS transporter, CP family, cyanate transporter [Rosenbergiella nectarea]